MDVPKREYTFTNPIKMKQLALAILDWMITAIFLAGTAALLLTAYFGIKEEIRHRNAVADLRVEYAQAIQNLQVR